MNRGIKKMLVAVMALAMIAPGASAEGQAYTGTGKGMMSDIKVSVTLDGEKIAAVEVLEHGETAGISDKALAEVPQAIVAENSASVEAISGATGTSNGIMQAVSDALTQAGMKTEEIKDAGPIAIPEHEDINKTETLNEWQQAWIDREIESSVKYKAKVKTLENGIRVQAVPDDNRYWNVGVINAEERGCNACHKLEDALENLPKKHNTFRTIGTMEMNVQSCMGCHRGYHEAWKSNAIVLDDALHSLHYNSAAFTGNCLSCHQIDNEGNYVMWDYVKYQKLLGIAEVADVQGEFRFDQDVTVDIDDLFVMYGAQFDPNGIPDYAPDNEEIFNNWEIKISGDVEKPYTIKLADIAQEDMITYNLTHHCVIENGGLIGSVSLTGLSLAEAIEKAVPKEGANQISVIADGGYEYEGAFTYPLADVMASEKSMFAMYSEGEHITAELGYPVICMLEGMPACHSQRFVREIVVQTVDEIVPTYGYLDYGVEGDDINNYQTCGVVNVYNGQIFEYGEPIVFEGYADAYADTVTCVKFSLDNGKTWTKYDIPNADNDRWVYFWYEPQELPLGSYVLTIDAESARGTDADHNFQLLFHVQ